MKKKKEEEEEETDKEIFGEIICQLNIKNENEETKLLGDEFIKDSKLDIY